MFKLINDIDKSQTHPGSCFYNIIKLTNIYSAVDIHGVITLCSDKKLLNVNLKLKLRNSRRT